MIEGVSLYTQHAMELTFWLGMLVGVVIALFTVYLQCIIPTEKPSDKARGVKGSSPGAHGFTAPASSKHRAGHHKASYGSVKGMRNDHLEMMMRALNAARDEVVEEMLRRRTKK